MIKPLPSHRGFTLVEILIVVAIMAICLGIGIPTIFRAARKDPLRQAVSDIMEGCKEARSEAILHGAPYDFIIRANGGSLSVARAQSVVHDSAQALDAHPRAAVTQVRSPFAAKLHEDIIVEVIFLNLRDQMESEETRVRFHPNGLCDELRIILNWSQQRRMMVTVDPMTGIPDLEGL